MIHAPVKLNLSPSLADVRLVSAFVKKVKMEPVKKFVTTVYGPGPHIIYHGLGREVLLTVYDEKMQSVSFFQTKSFYGHVEVEFGVFGWIDGKPHWFIPKEGSNQYTVVVIG
jgi:hypothetical protein